MNIPTMRVFTALMVSTGMIGGFTAHAELINDNFSLSSGTWVSSVTSTEASGVGTYSDIFGANGMAVTTVSGFGNGNVLALTNSSAVTHYRAFNDAETLTLNSLAADETLRLTLDIRYFGNFGGADNFSFGFVNRGSPNSILYANLDLNSSGGTSSEFRYRVGSFNMSDGGLITGSSFTESNTVSAVNYSLQLDITHQLAGGFVVDYYRDGSLIGTHTAVDGSAFDTAMGDVSITGIAFRHSQTPGLITYIDNVNVSVVPEPATGLLLLSGAAILFYRRRILGKM